MGAPPKPPPATPSGPSCPPRIPVPGLPSISAETAAPLYLNGKGNARKASGRALTTEKKMSLSTFREEGDEEGRRRQWQKWNAVRSRVQQHSA